MYSSGNHILKKGYLKIGKSAENLQPKLKYYPYKKKENLFRLEKKQLGGKDYQRI